MNMNPLSFYELKVEYVDGIGEWIVNCHRCGLIKKTSRDGPFKCSPDLTMIINTHICDPRNRMS